MSRRTLQTKPENREPDLTTEVLRSAIAAGIPPKEYASHFLKNLRKTADPVRALTNYLRFLRSGFTASLLRDFHARPILEEIFLRIASQSQLLSDILIRTPELLQWLTASDALTRTRSREELVAEALQAIAPFERNEKRLNALKRFHRRESLRLGVREILGEASNDVVAGEVAALADSVLEAVLRIAADDLHRRTGGSVAVDLALIGLGKLGGEELNFSSDIDIMFVYEQDEEFKTPLDGAHNRHHLCVRLVESMMRMLTEHTEEGYLYRVDLRLRPDGQAGPVAMSRAAYLAYYESRGELWERQMLLKARTVAGDASTGARFLDDLRPFVYPRSHLRSPLEEIAAIKRKIEEKAAGRENIKLGSGGIRDIEFIVQALQLLHAGPNPSLRLRGTRAVLPVLARAGHLTPVEADECIAAYDFLRTVEHRLQLLEGRQTHALPQRAEELELLARRLSYPSAARFRSDLRNHQESVRRVFARIFGPVPREPRQRQRTTHPVAGLPESMTGPLARCMEMLPSADPLLFTRVCERMTRGIVPAEFVWNRFLSLAEFDPIRRTLAAAVGNERFLELLLRTCMSSALLVRLLRNEPLFFESIAGNPGLLQESASGWDFLRNSERGRFKSYNEGRILLRFLAQLITVESACEELSRLADEIVQSAWGEAMEEAGKSAAEDIVVIALGKAGGSELTVGSDLDLLFIDMSGRRRKNAGDSMPRRFLHLITENIPVCYRVDLRLRPEGKNAPIVSTLPYVREYFHGRAQLWERQSLLRARPIAGHPERCAEAGQALQEITYEAPLPERWSTEMMEMRVRVERERSRSGKQRIDLKTGNGGLMDIEFLVQALLLEHGSRMPEVRSTSTLGGIRALRQGKALLPAVAGKMERHYLWMRTLELYLRMNTTVAEFVWPPARELALPLAAMMEEKSCEGLERRLQEVLAQNRTMMDAGFKALKGKQE